MTRILSVLSVLCVAALAACGAASSAGDSKEIRLYADGDVNVQNLWQSTLIPGFEQANPG